MTIVYGQIESLKKLREKLNQNGITRFNSIGDIDNFKKNYEEEKSEISQRTEKSLDSEINCLQSDLVKLEQDYDSLKAKKETALNYEISYLKGRLFQIRKARNILKKIFLSPSLLILKLKISNREKNFEKIIQRQIKSSEKELKSAKKILDNYSKNRKQILAERILPKHQKLEFTKKTVEELSSLIAGAIGETQVVKELQKLPDKYYLFNDYSLEFNPPIYNKNEDDRIYSIQIDHLLVSNAGIFVLETKNWSKNSIKSYSLRSPVAQIKRTSFALFVLLNSNSADSVLYLKNHHWGDKKIPIRNVIVMIHEKPKEEFKFAKVITLNELIGYISYFEPIFDDDEVHSIVNCLKLI